MGDMFESHLRTKSVNICHQPAHEHDPVVAISSEMMDLTKGTNPANNKRCGSLIKIWNPRTRKAFEAQIVDICDKCKLMDIAVYPSFFRKIAPYASEKVAHEIAWGGEAVGG